MMVRSILTPPTAKLGTALVGCQNAGCAHRAAGLAKRPPWLSLPGSLGHADLQVLGLWATRVAGGPWVGPPACHLAPPRGHSYARGPSRRWAECPASSGLLPGLTPGLPSALSTPSAAGPWVLGVSSGLDASKVAALPASPSRTAPGLRPLLPPLRWGWKQVAPPQTPWGAVRHPSCTPCPSQVYCTPGH